MVNVLQSACCSCVGIFDYKGQRSAGNRTEVESTELLLYYYIMYLHIGTKHRTTINCADGPDRVENRRRVLLLLQYNDDTRFCIELFFVFLIIAKSISMRKKKASAASYTLPIFIYY